MGEVGLWVALVFFKYLFYLSTARDTMSPNQPLRDGQTLISEDKIFELGFFGSSDRYLGIWYTNIPAKVVWVANREAPINSSDTGSLTITPDGTLNIIGSDKIIWSTGTPGALANDAFTLKLLDTGNLMLNDSRSLIWQSFDHPSHAMLPGMKIGNDFRANLEWHLTSWKSDSDPSPGTYTYIIYPRGPPEGYVVNGSTWVWRSGTWTGHGWNGLPSMDSDNYFNFQVVFDHDELYYMFELRNKSIASALMLNPDGVLERWVSDGLESNLYWKLPADACDTYAVCGGYGVCQINSPPVDNCSCLKGFQPLDGVAWGLRNWKGGCTRRVALGCEEDRFVIKTQMKLPETTNTSWDTSKGIDECREWCLRNCLCQAFAVTNVGGTGCIVWFGELMDIREFTQGGEDLYVRLAASEIKDFGIQILQKPGFHDKKRRVLVITCAVFSCVILLSISLCIFWVRQRKEKRSLKQLEITTLDDTNNDHEVNRYDELTDNAMKDRGLPLFTFSAIVISTNNFSEENKIGEGGFGSVYKGLLSPNGQEIAVKRLSKGSVQGLDEFKNEIELIANLQHKNLVRLLGCCTKDEERILVYEYMPNRSLDCFLFDPIKAASLNWQTRIRVIHGVAQGILYLHEYSRLKIIHRDLKSGNILLDSEMNPKITDFGIARIFGGNQDRASTSRVVGTYGYMPPEYAMEGCFSEKTDVFSFGVLLLEIVSGKRNCGSPQVGHSRFLTGYVWQLWMVGRVSEMMDPIIRNSCPLQDLIRYVHVGLLCVQEEASERPSMSTVVSFLSSEILKLPKPKRVAFFKRRRENVESALLVEDCFSSNELTFTSPSPR